MIPRSYHQWYNLKNDDGVAADMSRPKIKYVDETQFNTELGKHCERVAGILSSARQAAGISKEQAAETAHISVATLYRIEHGLSDIKLYEFVRLCRLYGIEPELISNRLFIDSQSKKDGAFAKTVEEMANMSVKDQEFILNVILNYKRANTDG